MERIARACMQSILKLVNSVMGIAGIVMILYGLWMFRAWQRDMEGSPFYDFDSSVPWFIYTFVGSGVSLCIIASFGHIAADSANGLCLFCFVVIMFLLLLLEASVAADILLNSDWEKDLPEDPTGRFRDFEVFVTSNSDIFKWIGLLILLAQGSSLLLGMALRALGPHRQSNYDSDDEYPQARLPLIHPHVQPPPYVVADPRFAPKTDSWNTNK